MNKNEYFSDEEIKMAKLTFKKTDRIYALLSRLEAAENACRMINENHKVWPIEMTQALLDWRKAAGRRTPARNTGPVSAPTWAS